jgi:hypothetical protein
MVLLGFLGYDCWKKVPARILSLGTSFQTAISRETSRNILRLFFPPTNSQK